MKVTEQIDACIRWAPNPVKYLSVPRFIALRAQHPAFDVMAIFVGSHRGLSSLSIALHSHDGST